MDEENDSKIGNTNILTSDTSEIANVLNKYFNRSKKIVHFVFTIDI